MSTVTFSDLESTLIAAGCETRAAECHATLVGLICAGAPLPDDWVSQATGSAGLVAADCHDLLDKLQRQMQTDLADGQMAFDLLLPDDDASLAERTDALAQWCQGFLFGLTAGGIESNKPLPGEVAGVVSDFSDLSQAHHDGESSDEDERAYVELCEYVRVAAQLVYEELVAGQRATR